MEDKIVFQYFVSEPWLINVLPGIMVSREANNRHLHTRHHRVEGINTVMIEIFGQNPDKSVQITEMVKSEKNLETSTMR